MASSTAVDLENVPSVDNTMIDFFRRLKCQSKLDKRLILIGIHFFLMFLLILERDEWHSGFWSTWKKNSIPDYGVKSTQIRKGTQSPIIKDDCCLCHLATGDMLRAVVSTKTPLEIKAKEAMEKGELVTDDLVVGIIDEAMKRPSCQKGSFLMDYLELWFKQKSELKITSDSESEIPLSDDKYSGS
ncbi:hypothetical protein IFM89_037784 [Coptis chinensis]|uniref:adenylate kinase n=1 Tax=Coptis chinensis TaxID=261450 RepID=A0A835HE39_9MAGN|nr:hypothetical protein IFM89_037784 [Coptis chinensis]